MVGGLVSGAHKKRLAQRRFYRCALWEPDNATLINRPHAGIMMAMKSSVAGPKICSPRFKPLKRLAPSSKDTT